MRVAIIFVLTFLSACASAGDGRFPSLATRPGERVSGTLEPAPAAPPPPATAATGSRVAALREQAFTAHRLFGERRGSAESLSNAARGAAPGTEAWSVAQVALADLEAARSQAVVALADLDALYVAAQDAAVASGGESGDFTAIGAARDDVVARIAEEDATLAALRARLRE